MIEGGYRTLACDGKVAFKSWRQAHQASKRRPGRHPYLCPYCREFHVGSDPGDSPNEFRHRAKRERRRQKGKKR